MLVVKRVMLFFCDIKRFCRGNFGYNFCIKKKETILAIGDNIQTDIRGANRMKFDSLFITSGIHKKEFLNLPVKDYDKVLRKYKTETNYYQERLSW